jgi:hypothetical protein
MSQAVANHRFTDELAHRSRSPFCDISRRFSLIVKKVSRTVAIGKPGVAIVEPGTGRAQTRPAPADTVNETELSDL